MANTSLTADQDHATLSARVADDWGDIVSIRAKLSVEVAFDRLTVRELCGLEKGAVLASRHPAGAPVPVAVARVFVGWGEFQVVGEKLALRISEMG